MRRNDPGTLRTYAIGYEDPTFSELPYAQRIADLFDSEHHVLMIEPLTPERIRRDPERSVEMEPRSAREEGGRARSQLPGTHVFRMFSIPTLILPSFLPPSLPPPSRPTSLPHHPGPGGQG